MTNRTKTLLMVLGVFAVGHWAVTAIFWSLLPDQFIFTLGNFATPTILDKPWLLLFNVATTLLAVVVASLYRVRTRLSLPLSALAEASEQQQALFKERLYQLLLLMSAFLMMIAIYWQTSLCLYTLGRLATFRPVALLAAAGIMLAYLAYNAYLMLKTLER